MKANAENLIKCLKALGDKRGKDYVVRTCHNDGEKSISFSINKDFFTEVYGICSCFCLNHESIININREYNLFDVIATKAFFVDYDLDSTFFENVYGIKIVEQ